MQAKAVLPVVLLSLTSASAHAEPPAPHAFMSCSVTLPSATILATFDDSMSGTVTVDGAVGTRRFKIKSLPYSATYNLMFQGYGAGDVKPAAESLTTGKSVVARLVQYDTVTHLFLDSDYHLPSVRMPMEGFICK